MSNQDVMTITERVEAIHSVLNYFERKSLSTAIVATYQVEQDPIYNFIGHIKAVFQGFRISIYVGPSLILGECETDIAMYHEVHGELITMFDGLGWPYSTMSMHDLEGDDLAIKVH